MGLSELYEPMIMDLEAAGAGGCNQGQNPSGREDEQFSEVSSAKLQASV